MSQAPRPNMYCERTCSYQSASSWLHSRSSSGANLIQRAQQQLHSVGQLLHTLLRLGQPVGSAACLCCMAGSRLLQLSSRGCQLLV